MIDVQDNVLRFFAINHVPVSFVTIATTGTIFSLQFTKNRLAAGLRSDPLGELSAPPDPLPQNRGPTSKGRVREGRTGGKGMRRERAPLTQIPGSAPGESIPQNATSREQTHFKSQRSRARGQSVVVFFCLCRRP